MIEISIDPIAFTLGSLEVRWYGIMVALGVTQVVCWMFWQVKRGAPISYNTLFTAALVGIPSAVIVSRLLHVLDRWEYFSQHPGDIIGGSGLTIYGAILGAALGLWIYSRVGRFQFGYFIDLLAPTTILGQAIGRVGCTINGCCHGIPTSLPWGVIYTHPDSLAPIGVAVHPTQVYEIIFLLLLFGAIFMLRNRLKPSGSLFLVYLSSYSVWRLGIGFLRQGTDFLFGLHQAQVIAIIVLAITVSLLVLRTRWVRVEERVNSE